MTQKPFWQTHQTTLPVTNDIEGKFRELVSGDKVKHHRVFNNKESVATLEITKVTQTRIRCGMFAFNRTTGIDCKNGKSSWISLGGFTTPPRENGYFKPFKIA